MAYSGQNAYDPTLESTEESSSSHHGGTEPVGNGRSDSESGDGATSKITTGFSVDRILWRGAANLEATSSKHCSGAGAGTIEACASSPSTRRDS